MSRLDAFKLECDRVLKKADSLYGTNLATGVVPRYDVRGKSAGWAACKWCAITKNKIFHLRFNRQFIEGDSTYEDMRDDTIPHEIAHLVAYARPELGARKHNPIWKRICIALGGTGKRCHAYEVAPVKPRNTNNDIDYMTDRGVRVTVSRTIHTRIHTRGASYTYKNGDGTIHKGMPWCAKGGVMPATPPAFAMPPAASAIPWTDQTVTSPPTRGDIAGYNTVTPGISKAEQVRIWIRHAKKVGNPIGYVVAAAMVNLGMPKGQAVKYVTENWSRA